MVDDNDASEYMQAVHRFGISKCYGTAELHSVYRRLVKETHPDRAIDEADRQRRMQEMISINQTYRYLRRMVGTFDAVDDSVENHDVSDNGVKESAVENGVNEHSNSHTSESSEANVEDGNDAVNNDIHNDDVKYAYTSDEPVMMPEQSEHSFKDSVASFIKAGQARLNITWMHMTVIIVGIIATLMLSATGNYLALACAVFVLIEFETRVVSKAINVMINAVRHIIFNVIVPFFDTAFYGVRFIGSSVSHK